MGRQDEFEVRFLNAGDTAIIAEFGDRIDRALSDRVLRLAATVRNANLPGVIEAVPTFRSLMVHYDPLQTDHGTLERELTLLLQDDGASLGQARLWHVPACYETTHAPDLHEVAQRTGLSAAEVIALHTQTLFHVYMIGFLPGHPYMGDLPAVLELPRRADPRVRVPAGSIAIASSLSVIYPVESPGGWHLIGATPIRLFDAGWARPALFSPGDKVRFEPIDASQFETIRQASATGDYEVSSESIAP